MNECIKKNFDKIIIGGVAIYGMVCVKHILLKAMDTYPSMEGSISISKMQASFSFK